MELMLLVVVQIQNKEIVHTPIQTQPKFQMVYLQS